MVQIFMTALSKSEFCTMCGATPRDTWETFPSRHAELLLKERAGSPNEEWTICDECFEGLQNAAPIKPDRIQLLAQIRRATIDDQKEVLNWLLTKFKISVGESNGS